MTMHICYTRKHGLDIVVGIIAIDGVSKYVTTGFNVELVKQRTQAEYNKLTF